PSRLYVRSDGRYLLAERLSPPAVIPHRQPVGTVQPTSVPSGCKPDINTINTISSLIVGTAFLIQGDRWCYGPHRRAGSYWTLFAGPPGCQ
ncbi:hypothetical protein GOODEAATRI_033850, partial [Goodea atripinnis]